MKSLFYIITAFLFIVSCSNDDDSEPAPESVQTPQTELISLDYTDNSIKIKWRPVEIQGFISYEIYRLESATNIYPYVPAIASLGELRGEITNSNEFSFEDTNIPYNAYVNYVVATIYQDPIRGYTQGVVSVNYLYYERPELSFEIISAEKLDNGHIKLEWEQDENDSFSKYTVYRTESDYDYSEYRAEIFENEFSIIEISNQAETPFEDSTGFLNEYITYGVSKDINGKTIESKNTVTIKNPRFIDFVPIEMFKNPVRENELIIISDDGKILFYNPYNYTTVHAIDIEARIHHPVIETYNGIQQLYIPTENGKIFVYSLDDYNLMQDIDLDTDRDILSMVIKEHYVIFLEKYINGYFSHFSYYDFESDEVYRNTGFIHRSSRLVNGSGSFFFILEPAYTGHQNESSLNTYRFVDGELEFSLGIDNGSIKSEKVFAVAPDFSYIISTEYGFHLSLDYNDMSEEKLGNYGHPMTFDGFNFVGSQEEYSDIHITETNEVYFSIKELNKIVKHQHLNFGANSGEFDTQGQPILFSFLGEDIIVINHAENSFKSFVEIIDN